MLILRSSQYKTKHIEDKMIILHCATAEETKQKVYGYALRENGKAFIVQEDGVRIPARQKAILDIMNSVLNNDE